MILMHSPHGAPTVRSPKLSLERIVALTVNVCLWAAVIFTAIKLVG